MDVFNHRERVTANYDHIARSFTEMRAADLDWQINEVYADDRFWPEPLIDPRFKAAPNVDQLVAAASLPPACATIFRNRADARRARWRTSPALTFTRSRRSSSVTAPHRSRRSAPVLSSRSEGDVMLVCQHAHVRH